MHIVYGYETIKKNVSSSQSTKIVTLDYTQEVVAVGGGVIKEISPVRFFTICHGFPICAHEPYVF